jgi:hypothetical protein
VLITVVAVVAAAGGYALVGKLFNRTYSESKADWKSHSFPGTGLTVELPGEPKDTGLNAPAELKSKITKMEAYECTMGDFSCMVMYAAYADGIEASAEGGARGAAENLKKTSGVGNLQYKIADLGRSRVGLSGTCTLSGRPAVLDGFVSARGEKLWCVFTLYAEENGEARDASKRVLGSAGIL